MIDDNHQLGAGRPRRAAVAAAAAAALAVSGVAAIALAGTASAATLPGTLSCNTASNQPAYQSEWTDTNTFSLTPSSAVASNPVTATWTSATGLTNGSPSSLLQHTVQVQVLVGLTGAVTGDILATTTPDTYPAATVASLDPTGGFTATATFVPAASGPLNATLREVVFNAGTLDTYCSSYVGVHTTGPTVNTGNYPAVAPVPDPAPTYVSGFTPALQVGTSTDTTPGTSGSFADIAAGGHDAITLPTAVTLHASKSTVTVGGSVTLSGTLKNGTDALASKAVQLQSRASSSGAWANLGSAVSTSGTGAFSKTVKPTQNAQYRAVFAAAGGFAAATSSTSTVKVTPTVSIKLSATTVKFHKSVTFSGKVAPNAHGQAVYLQHKSGAKWVNVKKLTLSGSSAYSYSYKTVSHSDWSWRVYRPADSHHNAATSAVKKLTVK